MPYERVSARRRIHELFLELRKAAVATRDGNTASKVDLIINLWNQMMHAEDEAFAALEDHDLVAACLAGSQRARLSLCQR